jgi:hypothetical protein
MNGTIIPSWITLTFHVALAKIDRNLVVPACLMTTPVAGACANVVTDWDEKAMDVIQGNAPAPPPSSTPSIIMLSRARSPPSATATLTAIRRLNALPCGS